MRNALIDAFTGMINGIKSPENNITVQDQLLILENITNMFFFVQELMKLEDLRISPEMAVQVLDLYGDIKQLGTKEQGQLILDQGLRANQEQFNRTISGSDLHNLILMKFGDYKDEIIKIDGGEALRRF
jgi:hypothetical protein